MELIKARVLNQAITVFCKGLYPLDLFAVCQRQESADWIGVEILNMFNIGSWPTVMR